MRNYIICLLLVATTGCLDSEKSTDDTPSSYDRSAQDSAVASDVDQQISYVIPKGWKYTRHDDKALGSHADVASTDEIPTDGSFKADSEMVASLIIRRDSKEGLDVFIVDNNLTFMCLDERPDKVFVSFDRSPALGWDCSGATGGSHAAFISDAGRFVAKVKTSSVVEIQAKTAEIGSKMFHFDVRGLKWGQ